MITEKDDQNNMNGNESNKLPQQDADNEYGLPEAEYSPIERDQSFQVQENQPASHTEAPADNDIQPQQKNSNAAVWLTLLGIILLAGVFVYFFVFREDAPQEQVTQRTQEVNTNPAPVEEQPSYNDDDWNNTPAEEEPEVVEGSVENVSSRTGRYYMIVGSFIDGDLARDYAGRLANDGYQAKIIEPSGTRKFYRLSVKDAESINDLNAELDSMKAKHGENVWIVKY